MRSSTAQSVFGCWRDQTCKMSCCWFWWRRVPDWDSNIDGERSDRTEEKKKKKKGGKRRWKLPWRKERSQKTGENIDQVDPQAAIKEEEAQIYDLEIGPGSGVLTDVPAVTLEVLYTPIVENTAEEMEEDLKNPLLMEEVEQNCDQLIETETPPETMSAEVEEDTEVHDQLMQNIPDESETECLVNDVDVIIEVPEVLEDNVVTVSVEPVDNQVIISVDEDGFNNQETTAGLAVDLMKEVDAPPIGIQILPADDCRASSERRSRERSRARRNYPISPEPPRLYNAVPSDHQWTVQQRTQRLRFDGEGHLADQRESRTWRSENPELFHPRPVRQFYPQQKKPVYGGEQRPHQRGKRRYRKGQNYRPGQQQRQSRSAH